MSAQSVIALVEAWIWVGAAVAVLFLTLGVDRIDEDAQGAYVFRLLLVPGVLLIWPLVLWRWARLEMGGGAWPARYRPPRATHLPAALIMVALLAFAVLAGLSVRQTWPADFAPVLLEAPGS